MNKPLLLAIISLFYVNVKAQTCTVTGTSPLNWPTNGAGIVCSEGGNAVGKTTLVIPAGFTVNLNDNADTWTGTTIEVHGRLNVTANPTVNATIVVKDGGVLNLVGKLSLGSGAGCPYTLVVATGGTVTVGATAADRLSICGQDIMKGSGACNDCGGTNSGECPSNGQPYCTPAGGFTGPSGYDEGGFNATLPVKLLYFNVKARDESVELNWATSMEENFFKFEVQRSADGLSFHDIGAVQGQGFNIHDVVSKYTFEDEAPLLGVNYYRLKAIDLDDSYEYFEVKAVEVEGPKKLVVYPNPASGQKISFRLNFSSQESDRIVIVDQLGVEVYNGAAVGQDGNIMLSHTLRSGVYLVRYVSRDGEQVARVVVKN